MFPITHMQKINKQHRLKPHEQGHSSGPTISACLFLTPIIALLLQSHETIQNDHSASNTRTTDNNAQFSPVTPMMHYDVRFRTVFVYIGLNCESLSVVPVFEAEWSSFLYLTPWTAHGYLSKTEKQSTSISLYIHVLETLTQTLPPALIPRKHAN